MKQLGRRDFLKIAGTSGAVAIGAGAVGAKSLTNAMPKQATNAPVGHGVSQSQMTWQEMDAHHQERVDIFLAGIGTDPTFWVTPLEYELDGDVKVFRLTCTEVEWEAEAGIVAVAMTYNGIVPGPEIRVTEGDRIRLIVTNEMTQSTAIHFHGLKIENSQDGVPMITQPVIRPGDIYTYEFTTRNAGTHMYHSHHNSAEQVTRGLLGALIIEPKDKTREPVVSAEYNLVLNDSGLGQFTINGRSFPYTQPIIAKKGDRIRVRYFNEGLMIHPMHLHGIPQLVFSKDGFPLPMPYLCDTLNIAPGERYDVIVDCDELGVWAFHCHILSHAEGPDGMFGMVTVLIVQE
ncbi:MAG: multicopper oxidase domain-containing protein [Phototrophicales bacterium]|nr:multicopper oxidase domain-containing protein [Phototrophicales bacterium]